MTNLKVWTVTAKTDRKKLSHTSRFSEEIRREQESDLSAFLLPAVRLLTEMHYKKVKE